MKLLALAHYYKGLYIALRVSSNNNTVQKTTMHKKIQYCKACIRIQKTYVKLPQLQCNATWDTNRQ